jgi:uncharacterized MAPEG superfamily protein
VVGVHSVTRNDKLLWFLGVRIHARDKALDLQDQMTEKLDALFDKYSNDIEKAEKEIEEMQQEILIPICQDYETVKMEIEKAMGQQITALQNRAERLERNFFIRFILFFAPALTECLTCMASFWGTIIFSLYFSGILSMSFFFVPIAMPFFLLSVAGLNTAIGKIIA